MALGRALIRETDIHCWTRHKVSSPLYLEPQLVHDRVMNVMSDLETVDISFVLRVVRVTKF